MLTSLFFFGLTTILGLAILGTFLTTWIVVTVMIRRSGPVEMLSMEFAVKYFVTMFMLAWGSLVIGALTQATVWSFLHLK